MDLGLTPDPRNLAHMPMTCSWSGLVWNMLAPQKNSWLILINNVTQFEVIMFFHQNSCTTESPNVQTFNWIILSYYYLLAFLDRGISWPHLAQAGPTRSWKNYCLRKFGSYSCCKFWGIWDWRCSCFLMLPHASSFNAKEYWPALLVFFSLQNLNADCKMKTNEKQCGGSLCKGMERMSQSPSVTNPRPRKHKNTEELNTSKIIYIYRSEYIFIQFYRSDIVRRIPQSLVWYIMPSIYKYHVHLTLRDAALWRLCLLATHRLPNCCAHVDSHHHHHHQRPWPENIGHTFLSHS